LRETFLISIILVFTSIFSLAQNRIELVANDCSEENGFTMFLLDRANPKILTNQKIGKTKKYLENNKMMIINKSDFLKIKYTNIFGQKIDTTFTNAKGLSEIKICVNKFKDYQRKSLIRESLQNKKSWTLNRTWGHQTIDHDKLILKSKKRVLIYKYYKNGKRIARGKIKITELILEKISLYERKLNLMKNADNSCNFGTNYTLNNGLMEINFQDNSCSGFLNEELLSELKKAE
jgi:hypothetical protein